LLPGVGQPSRAIIPGDDPGDQQPPERAIMMMKREPAWDLVRPIQADARPPAKPAIRDQRKLRRELSEFFREQPREMLEKRSHMVGCVMEIVLQHAAAKRKKGRPPGTTKYEEFDTAIFSAVSIAVAGRSAAFATALVRKEVKERWERAVASMRQLGKSAEDAEVATQRGIGRNVDAAVARIMKRLRGAGAYDVLYPSAFPVAAAKVRRRIVKTSTPKDQL
jgi:hypothetical protein